MFFRQKPKLGSPKYVEAYRRAAEASLSALKEISRAKKRHGLVLYAVVRNEYDLLPDFLSHYRDMGVLRFVIIDNDSGDGSRELLAAQEDVDLYWTSGGFAKTNFGRLWIDGLAQASSMGSWILIADADERLIYSDYETRKLAQLIHNLETKAITKFFAPLLDLYILPGEEGIYFDAAPDRLSWWSEGPAITGGPRYRMAADLGDVSTVPLLTKYPLLFYTAETIHEHLHFPAPMDTNGVEYWGRLLHLKMTSRFERKIEEAIEEGQHWDNSKEYRVYSKWVSRDRRAECTRKFEGSASEIIAAGLMNAIDWSKKCGLM